MRRKYAIIFAALLGLLALGIGVATLARNSAKSRIVPATLAVAQPWNDDATLAALNRVLASFHSLYPAITVSLLSPADSTASQADIACFSDTAGLSRPWADPPSPWTGNLWFLAARSDVLKKIEAGLPGEVAALRSGACTPDQFRAILEAAAKTGIAPLTLGNSHKWPFVLLLEHWTAATAGPAAVASLPGPEDAATAAAYDELMRWKGLGWFAPGLWAEGWAKGLLPLDRGEAAFALVSAEYLSPIPPQRRNRLEFLAFPHRSEDPAWSVGSAVWIGVSASTPAPEAARLLVRYLTSPGVTDTLTKLTGQPFFSWDAKSGEMPAVSPNWTLADQSPEYRALVERFDPGE